MTNTMDAAVTFGDKASEAGERAEDLVRAAGKKLQEVHNDTVDGLHAAASSVRNTGRQGSKTIDNFTNSAADRLDATASYVENHYPGDVLTGLRRKVRRHPARSLAIAMTVGLFAGCALRQFTHTCGRRA